MNFQTYLKRDIKCACGHVHRCNIDTILIEAGALNKLPEILSENTYQDICILEDENTKLVMGDKVEQLVREHNYNVSTIVLPGDHLLPDESGIGSVVTELPVKCDLILAVGSGTINDLGKFVSYKTGVPYMIIGTAPSMDGFASNVAAMVTKKASSNDIREVATRMREAGIPLDSIGLDLEYLDDYKDFTINPKDYADFAELSKELKEQGVRLVPIIDAGVKIEKGYNIYEEGVEKGYFFKDKDGNDFVGAVWPGRCHFPDFLRPEVREWFGGHYKYLTDMGIEGFWNDMNEPTLFFTERGLKEAMGVVDELRDSQLDIPRRRRLLKAINGMANNLEDYKSIYHLIDGKQVSHDKVHNLYFDVFSSEPPREDEPLLTLPNFYLTPHIASRSKEAEKNTADLATKIIIEALG